MSLTDQQNAAIGGRGAALNNWQFQTAKEDSFIFGTFSGISLKNLRQSDSDYKNKHFKILILEIDLCLVFKYFNISEKPTLDIWAASNKQSTISPLCSSQMSFCCNCLDWFWRIHCLRVSTCLYAHAYFHYVCLQLQLRFNLFGEISVQSGQYQLLPQSQMEAGWGAQARQTKAARSLNIIIGLSEAIKPSLWRFLQLKPAYKPFAFLSRTCDLFAPSCTTRW